MVFKESDAAKVWSVGACMILIVLNNIYTYLMILYYVHALHKEYVIRQDI